jgi:hypothetical protein
MVVPNNQAHSGTSDYLNVSEMLMVKSSAFTKQATIRSPIDVLKKLTHPGITALPNASVHVAALHTPLFLMCRKVVHD